MNRKLAQQDRKIVCTIERPKRLQDGARLLLRPALADIAAEFPLHFGSAHRPLGEAGAAMVRERYAQDVTLPQLAMLFDRLASANK